MRVSAHGTQEVSSWWDSALKVRFPPRLAGLSIASRHTYGRGDADYSINYRSTGGEGNAVSGETLDVYLYTRPDREPNAKAVCDEVCDALAVIKEKMGQEGMADVVVGTNLLERVWGETGLTNIVGLCEFSGERIGGRFASVVSVAACSGRFLKLRYSLPVTDEEDVPARRFGEICGALDSLLAESARRARLDVYSAGSPEAVLGILRSKWPDAGERVSQWELPEWTSRVRLMNREQDWCAQDLANRVGQFEGLSRRGIETKTDPARWYYNLACAMSLQKRADEAFEALEQAVAAGFTDADHAMEDPDLANIRGDSRFGTLAEAARALDKAGPPFGVEPLRPQDGECLVSEETVSYEFVTRSYQCVVETDERRPIIYVDKNVKRTPVQCAGLVSPTFEEEAYDAGALGNTADMSFLLAPADGRRPFWCPAIVACAESADEDGTSIPEFIALSREDAYGELFHERLYNVLGIYAAGGFDGDGTDGFSCWSPVFIAHTGGAAEGGKFVKLAAEIIRALPAEVVEEAFSVPEIVQKIMRASQRGVSGEEGFMSGLAMRPVLDFGDIDEERALSAARAVDPKRLQPEAPIFKSVGTSFRATRVSDVQGGDKAVVSARHAGFVATWAERTGVIDAKLAVDGGCDRIERRVLAGDASRVRFESPEDGCTRIYIDYHEPFDEQFPSGRKLRSSRVDIGFFAVRGGVASMPSVLSVYFPPTESREYGADGKLRSVVYADKFSGQAQLERPRGEWRDVPHYDADGRMTGWTRYRRSRDGGVATDEFTADGLVVMTRDENSRPRLCRRDLRSTWRQSAPAASDPDGIADLYARLSEEYDSATDPPCGADATTLVWEYVYGEDGKGECRPVAPVPFCHRPELCPAADFGGESGICLPVLSQMRIGYGTYSEYKEGRTPAPMARGVTLRFAKSPALDGSRWPSDADEFDSAAGSRLFELGDGVYRATTKQVANAASAEFFSVERTYVTMNRASEYVAFSGMAQRYARCGEEEALAVLSSRTNELDVAAVCVNTGSEPLAAELLPEGKSMSCTMWRISDGLVFGVLSDYSDRFERRRFFFAVLGGSGEALTWDEFEEFPSQAIGDTVLAAARHEPNAVNNMAVLMHAGICNPDRPNAASVEKMLEFAAKGGCAEAAANLKALRGGRERATKPPPAPELIGSMIGEYTTVSDIWDDRWETPSREMTPSRHVYCWTGAERTVRITATVEAVEGELKWKLLQGDPGKVRLVALGNGTGSVRAEIDWHGVYLARGRDGKVRRTTRIEFGCVAVKDGLESEPCVVSVSASPHATREYDEAGWLRRISYVKPLLPGKVSSRFSLGDWEDVFEYTPDGRISGWTRIRSGEKDSESEHFTRDGLKVLTRDQLGRPLRCVRDFRATIYQRTARGEPSDRLDFVPELFEYRYSGPEDYLGRAAPLNSSFRDLQNRKSD